MRTLELNPKSKIVRDYYASLDQLSLLHKTHEGAVRSAFGNVLDACARKFRWTLVNEYEIRRKKKLLRVDGAIVDPWSLTHGFWEAKDEDDDLAVEAKKKIDLGYPDDNIIFQSPDRAILYQDGKRIADEGIGPERKEALVEVVREFFGYEPPHYEEWESAVADFKERVPQLARALEDLIAKERTYPHFEEAFTRFAQVCRISLNPQLTDDAVEKMLVQHILTERLFRRVFDNADFVRRNAIAIEIESVIDKLTARSFNREKFLGGLDRFYRAIEDTAGSIEDFSEKQGFLNKVYESFFQGFDEKTADTHGIVYTPQPIVRFMVKSVDEILQKEFGKSLGDKGVHILDPFVGTGNFLLSVMRHIPKTRLPSKYRSELHANEVMLLPYYIASMNIEHEYAELTGEYQPFEGLCLVDTFELAEAEQASFSVMTEKNTTRVEAQKRSPITVIIGNPPYNAWQVSENDGNKNRKYKVVDARVAETYATDSNATLVNSLSDPYVKAFRWASDRLGDEGVLAYVSNNSYVAQLAFDGMRKHLAKDFDAIYVLDLGGNVRKNPKLSGTTHNVFGIQVGVSIGLFVRRKGSVAKRSANIYYARVSEDWRKETKYHFLDEHGTVGGLIWKSLVPDPKENWLTEGLKEEFDSFMPLGGKPGIDGEPKAIFGLTSNGIKSQRDAWAFSFSRTALLQNARHFAEAYNAEVARYELAGKRTDVDSFVKMHVKWSETLKGHLSRGSRLQVKDGDASEVLYRPFTRVFGIVKPIIVDRLGHWESLIGQGPGDSSRVICVPGPGNRQLFNVLVVSAPIAFDFAFEKAVGCGLLRWGEQTGARDNVTDWSLGQFRSHYDDRQITKWSIFHYVYGLLHHPEYRARYAANLKRELPRIPFAPDFWSLARAGEKLAGLHLDYEKRPEYPLKRIETPDLPLDWRVEKMKLSKDKTTLAYNDFLTLGGIPPETFEYRLGNRSALEWIVDQYQVSTDKRSGIVNDPNRADDPEYIVRLIGQIVTVSLETMKIVRALPPLDAEPMPAKQEGAHTPLDEQVAELKALRKGWHEPDTEPPHPATLDAFARFLEVAVSQAGLETPFLYATPEGGAEAEWSLDGWALGVSITPTAKKMLVRATELVGKRSLQEEIKLRDEDAAATFAAFVKALDKGSSRARRA